MSERDPSPWLMALIIVAVLALTSIVIFLVGLAIDWLWRVNETLGIIAVGIVVFGWLVVIARGLVDE